MMSVTVLDRLSGATAALALAAAPFWWHVAVVEPPIDNVIAAFASAGIYPSDVCLAVLVVAAVARLVESVRGSASVPLAGMASLSLAVGALPAAALVSVPSAPDIELSLGVTAHLALLALASLGVCAIGVSPSWLCAGLVASGCLQAGLAIAQFGTQLSLVPHELRLPWLPGSDPNAPGMPVILDDDGRRVLRGFGTFPHPNILGGYLALGLVCLPLLGRSIRRGEWVWIPGSLLTVGLFVSFSRAAWLAALLGIGIWWACADFRRVRSWWVVCVVGVATLMLSASPLMPIVRNRLLPPASNPLEQGSIEHRLALDGVALEVIRLHFPLGVGAGNFGLASIADGYQEGWGEPAPNVPLLIGAELGLLGVLACVAIAWTATRALQRTRWTRRPEAVSAVAACVALVVLGMLDHYLWTTQPGRVIAWAPIALLGAAAVRQLDRSTRVDMATRD